MESSNRSTKTSDLQRLATRNRIKAFFLLATKSFTERKGRVHDSDLLAPINVESYLILPFKHILQGLNGELQEQIQKENVEKTTIDKEFNLHFGDKTLGFKDFVDELFKNKIISEDVKALILKISEDLSKLKVDTINPREAILEEAHTIYNMDILKNIILYRLEKGLGTNTVFDFSYRSNVSSNTEEMEETEERLHNVSQEEEKSENKIENNDSDINKPGAEKFQLLRRRMLQLQNQYSTPTPKKWLISTMVEELVDAGETETPEKALKDSKRCLWINFQLLMKFYPNAKVIGYFRHGLEIIDGIEPDTKKSNKKFLEEMIAHGNQKIDYNHPRIRYLSTIYKYLDKKENDKVQDQKSLQEEIESITPLIKDLLLNKPIEITLPQASERLQRKLENLPPIKFFRGYDQPELTPERKELIKEVNKKINKFSITSLFFSYDAKKDALKELRDMAMYSYSFDKKDSKKDVQNLIDAWKNIRHEYQKDGKPKLYSKTNAQIIDFHRVRKVDRLTKTRQFIEVLSNKFKPR